MAGGLSGAGFSRLVGVVSDRVGRRVFLLIYEAGLVVASEALVFWEQSDCPSEYLYDFWLWPRIEWSFEAGCASGTGMAGAGDFWSKPRSGVPL